MATTRTPFKRHLMVWLAAACLFLTGCVTETTNRMAQNKDPKRALKANVDAGMMYLQRGQMDNAHRTLHRAYEIDSRDPSVNNALALFYKIEGDKAQVEKHFKRALVTDPAFSQARNNYAAFLYDEGRFKEAVDQLERVTKDYRYERRFTAFENLGLCYLRVNEVEKAEVAFNTALRLNANMATSMLELASINLDKGDNVAALRYLSSYEKTATPTARQLWIGIRLQRILGDKNKLASYELALRNMFPGSPEYQAYLASRQP